MREMLEIRQKNLLRLIGDEKLSVFARKHGIDATFLSQIKTGKRTLGEKAALKMEMSIGLEPGCLSRIDLSTVDGISDDEIISVVTAAIPSLSQDAKTKLLKVISASL